ncbi:MAG: Bacterial actin-related protein [Candidatus Heimdallarchaeota archaeon LC_3]|uniref:Putative actin-related protein n=1 Tax=uncultured organism TaxID=155900 RepID=A0A0F6PXL4_9ZZZZ|nr:putative actin-related protein [uncultured organism]OLS26637.1 MAG: Bacterial actin-related protein [Candidatus Heimdallarchaeota archaeon LC_3]
MIIDLGSQHIKIGYSGEGYPRFVIPSVVGYKVYPPDPSEAPLIAYDALYEKEIHLTYPFQEATITARAEWDWLSAKELISHSVRKLNIKPEEYYVFYIEPLHSNPTNTSRLIQLLKEKFRFPEVFTFKQSRLSMQEIGKVSGMLLELGHSMSSIVSYYKGFEIDPSLRFFSISGRIIAEQYVKHLRKQLGDNTTTYELVRVIDKHFYVAKDYEQEKEDYDRGYIKDVEETLPFSGRKITIGDERFRIPESLFNPDLLDPEIAETFDAEGLMTVLQNVLKQVPLDTRPEILSNIILSGGLSKLKGLDERLIEEFKKLFPNLDINIVAHQRREITSWFGAEATCNKGISENLPLQSRYLTFTVPTVVEQLYNEAIDCEKQKLWLATTFMSVNTIEAAIRNLSTLDVPMLSVFAALKDEGIIDGEFFKWANSFSFLRNPGYKNIVQTITRAAAADIVEFLKRFLEIMYKPPDDSRENIRK